MNAQELMKEISERIQKNANVKTVFGEPYEKGTVTIIPVARVDIIGGGWEANVPALGTEQKEVSETEEGNDMGLSICTIPLGYIEVKEDGARFVEIQYANRLALAGLALGGFLIYSLSRVLIHFLKED